MIHEMRIARHTRVSTELALQSDRQLSALLDRSEVASTGIGGTSVVLDVNGVRVFAKRIRLTALELEPENVMSTSNLFGLPAFYQYGVGSPGFNAWRELAANVMTTNWVLSGRNHSFPLLHHWRVLPGVAAAADETTNAAPAVAYWDESAAMRNRIDALARSYASVVLFLEHVPHTLTEWLSSRSTAGRSTEADFSTLGVALLSAVEFMNANGLMHFDAHFENILTDGHQLYVADLGLATSTRFDLSEDEALFLRHHRTHDIGYAVMRLVNWLVGTAHGGAGASYEADVRERNRKIKAYAAGVEPDVSSPIVATQIRRYAPVAAVMNDFYWQLFTGSRATTYPAAEIAHALAAASRPVPGA